MIVINETQLLSYWIWYWLHREAMEEWTPEWLESIVARFKVLTYRDQVDLMTEMQKSEWNI